MGKPGSPISFGHHGEGTVVLPAIYITCLACISSTISRTSIKLRGGSLIISLTLTPYFSYSNIHSVLSNMSRISLPWMPSSASRRLGDIVGVEEDRAEQGSRYKTIGSINPRLILNLSRSPENRTRVAGRMYPVEEYFNRLFSCPEIFQSIAAHLHQRDIRSFSLVSNATATITRFAGRGSISNGCAPWTCGGLRRKPEYRGFCSWCYIPGCDVGNLNLGQCTSSC